MEKYVKISIEELYDIVRKFKVGDCMDYIAYYTNENGYDEFEGTFGIARVVTPFNNDIIMTAYYYGGSSGEVYLMDNFDWDKNACDKQKEIDKLWEFIKGFCLCVDKKVWVKVEVEENLVLVETTSMIIESVSDKRY